MPPKAAKKSKVEEPPPSATTPKPRAKRASTSAKKPSSNQAPKLSPLTSDGKTVPVAVNLEAGNPHSIPGEHGNNRLGLLLNAPHPFTLVKSVAFTDGEFAGMQAIYIKPAKSFPFLELPKEARKRIYDNYFAPKGVLHDDIPVDKKRGKDPKNWYSSTYADGMKDRVALLRVNKEIHADTIQILYAHKIKFETTTVMQDFLIEYDSTRKLLSNVAIQTWTKTTAKSAMMLLSESSKLSKLYIGTSITAEDDPAKAADQFKKEAYKFLDSFSAAKGDKSAAVDSITFGKKALVHKTKKDEKGLNKAYSTDEVKEFKEALKEKLTK